MVPERKRDGNYVKGKRSTVRTTYAVKPKDIKRAKDMMLMLGSNETIDQLAMANSVH